MLYDKILIIEILQVLNENYDVKIRVICMFLLTNAGYE